MRRRYRPDSFLRIDDRTGFTVRAEQTRREWNGLIVADKVFELRQPQDFVRGVRDRQSVPDPRPDSPHVSIGPIYLTVSADCLPGAYDVPVLEVDTAAVGDSVGIFLASGEIFRTKIAGGSALLDAQGNALLDAQGNILTDNEGLTGSTVRLLRALPGYVRAGNLIIDYAPGSGS